jgi:hypothetical protein
MFMICIMARRLRKVRKQELFHPRDEQRRCAVFGNLVQTGLLDRRQVNRSHAINNLTLDPHSFAARRKKGRARAAHQKRFRQDRHGLDEMLAIVEHQQQLLVPDAARYGFSRNTIGPRANRSAAATAAGTSVGSDRDASSIKQPPPANPPMIPRATSRARLDLPIPPGPVSMTAR